VQCTDHAWCTGTQAGLALSCTGAIDGQVPPDRKASLHLLYRPLHERSHLLLRRALRAVQLAAQRADVCLLTVALMCFSINPKAKPLYVLEKIEIFSEIALKNTLI
jgi:hypothetical protein